MTTYDDIYDRFLAKITDYELSALMDSDLENQCHKFLKAAITDFKYCNKDLSNRDETGKSFNIDLSDFEQEILSKFMLVHWLEPDVLRSENLRNFFGTKDFSTFSPANIIDKLNTLKTTLINEANSDMIYYYYAT